MRRRSGFTITELLVAMALIVFVMSILATAFSEGMQTFRRLKGIGDMNQRLRTVSSMLQDDLQSPHLEGRRRLSDLNFWTTTALPAENGPPREGFVRIWQGSPLSGTAGAPYYLEGADLDYQIPSVRATDHILHFTVKKLGNDPKNFFRAGVTSTSPLIQFGNYLGRFQDDPATGIYTFTSQWAEVAWFMRPNGQNANGTPLFTLYRRQRVIVGNPETGGYPNSPGVNLNWTNPPVVPQTPQANPPVNNYNDNGPAGTGNNYLGISCRTIGVNGGEVYFNSPNDLTVPQYRFSMQQPGGTAGKTGGIPPQATGTYPPNMSTGAYYYYVFQPPSGQQGYNPNADPVEEITNNPNIQGADVVITDVISFAVRVLTPTSGSFVDLPQVGTSANSLFSASTGPFVYDTWSSVKNHQVDYSMWNTPNTSTSAPLQASIQAIQIQLRVWDIKTEQTRQITLVVDM
jgi:prepilin-type N-terminal cleavage/methylation domain-containing protein